MLKEFDFFIKTHQLFRPEDKLLLAVSGGIDSVVLAHLCAASGFRFGLAHCNFGLRGKESDGDELFVRKLAAKLKVGYHSIRFDTNGIAKKKGESVQMTARDLRYNWFEHIRAEYNYDRIVLAHHQGDAVETFFINLLRGTGISGLSGIPLRRNYIVRPLLEFGRGTIEKYASQMNLKHREDSSNTSDKYLRNALRHKIIPALEKMNPGLKETMIRNMEHLNQVNQVYRKSMGKELAKLKIKSSEFSINGSGIELVIDLQKLLKLDPVLLFLFELIRKFGFNETICRNILNTQLKGGSGQEFLSKTHRLIKDRKKLIIVRRKLVDFGGGLDELKDETKAMALKDETKAMALKAEAKAMAMKDETKAMALKDEYILEEGVKKMESPIILRVSKIKAKGFLIPRNSNTACLDQDKLKFPLIIRRWKKGDFFVPLGMKSKKKLSDFFIDAKFSQIEKEKTWLLVSGKDIVWVIGHRISELYKVKEKTNVIRIFIKEPEV